MSGDRSTEKTAASPSDNGKDNDLDEKTKGEDDEYAERGVIELDEDGQRRKVLVVVEEKSGREKFKDIKSGPYTKPQW